MEDLCEELLQGLVVLDVLNLVAELLGCHQILQRLDHQALQLREPLCVNIPRKVINQSTTSLHSSQNCYWGTFLESYLSINH